MLLALAGEALAIPSDDLLRSLRPTADVNDYAGLLSPSDKEAIEARCRELQKRTGAQLTVVTLKSMEGGQIDDFTNKLFARWSVGEKQKDNGIMLLVSMEERQSRIEVGYGLEPIIPDALTARILDHTLRPEFRRGDFAAGLLNSVNRICELIEKGEPADRNALARPQELDFGEKIIMVLFFCLFVAVGGLILGSSARIRQIAPAVMGAAFAGIPMLLAFGIAGLMALVIQVPLAIATTILGWKQGKNFKRSSGGQRGSGSYDPPTWTWGGTSGSSGGWSSGGGGFSQSWGGFGGGSSGGGGASSSW